MYFFFSIIMQYFWWPLMSHRNTVVVSLQPLSQVVKLMMFIPSYPNVIVLSFLVLISDYFEGFHQNVYDFDYCFTEKWYGSTC